ncbi:MAG TPA: hypothetical protein PKZ32_21645, partial [Candidatus Melainabacteria bacterium]|nr:hypothetical protein [Candidatus Melainabacteria bacterium]
TASGSFPPVSSAPVQPAASPQPFQAAHAAPAFPPPSPLQADTTANPFASAPAPQPQPQQQMPPQPQAMPAQGFETAPGVPAQDPTTAAAPAEGEEDEETVRDINDALRGLFR